MIEPQLTIHFFTTTPIVPGEHVKAGIVQYPGHPLDVGTTRVALQSVRENRQLVKFAFQPIQVEEIAIGCLNSFSNVGWQLYFPEDRGKDGLHMRVEKQKGRSVLHAAI